MVEQKIYPIDKPANSIIYPARLNGDDEGDRKTFP